MKFQLGDCLNVIQIQLDSRSWLNFHNYSMLQVQLIVPVLFCASKVLTSLSSNLVVFQSRPESEPVNDMA